MSDNTNKNAYDAFNGMSTVEKDNAIRKFFEDNGLKGVFESMTTGKPPAGYDANGKPITTTTTTITTAGNKPATSEPIRSTTTTVTPSTDPGIQRADNLSGMVSGAVGNTQSLYGDFYNQAMNFDPTNTDWGKAILSYYGIESGAAANGANASGAAENAGNVDSYAAANAQRQRLAALNQGINAVSNLGNQKFTTALQGLQAMGVDVNALLGIEGGNVGKTQGYLASLYQADQTAAANAPKTYPKYTDAEGAYIADQTFGLDFDFYGATTESLEKIKAAVAEKIASTFGLGPADAAAKAENAVNTIYQKAIGQ